GAGWGAGTKDGPGSPQDKKLDQSDGGIQLYSGGSDWGPGSAGSNSQSLVGWAYRDNNNGGWGPMNLSSFKKALSAMGGIWNDWDDGNPNVDSGTATKVTNQTIAGANQNCLARFDKLHPDQKGKGKCRMVGVGVNTTLSHKYDGTGFATANFWEAQWNKTVANKKYHNNNKIYYTNDAFFR
ncbi:hypothetical protein, partial [Bifidobacterium jacchi]|uniref:hypothetical protein n=1 Tax=Bifidobacterium jacchi TaxID=2490545 RepID=UPI00158808E1